MRRVGGYARHRDAEFGGRVQVDIVEAGAAQRGHSGSAGGQCGERRPVKLVVDERAYGWNAARQLRRISLQPRVEEAQVVPMRGVSLFEESDVVRLGAEHGNLHGITPPR